MRREPQPEPPAPGIAVGELGDTEPTGPHADALEAALDELGELGISVDDATLTVRNGQRLMLGEGHDITEIAHADPVRRRALTIGDADLTTDASLHWLMAEAFPDDHAFLQVRLTPSQADRIAERARDHGYDVADEIEQGRDDIETRLNVVRAMKSNDLVVTPRLGMLLRGPRTDETVERAEELLEAPDEGPDPRR